MTSGTLERFVKQHPGPEKKKELAMAWLEDLAFERAASRAHLRVGGASGFVLLEIKFCE